jgi:ribosomal protein S17E
MGKIKSKQTKRTAHALINKGVEFSEDFEYNKKVLQSTMPSKKMRNQIAGYLSRTKRQEKENQLDVPQEE